MTARYMVTYAIPSERPDTGCVIHDDKEHYRIVVGNPEWEGPQNQAAANSVPLLQADNPDAPLEDVLEGYLGGSGYVDVSEWGDSPYSYEDTINKLRNELQSQLHGAALERNARLAKIARAGVDAGVDLEPDNRSMTIVLDQSGEQARMSKPGLGYPVPAEAERNRIIQELLGFTDEEEPTVIVVPTDEEVLNEREDVQGSEEGS